MRDSPWTLPAAAAATLALAAALFFATHERVEEEVEIGPSGLARVDPFLGLERVLEGLGLPARAAWRIDAPPPADRAAVLAVEEPAARAAAWRRLEPWVAEGGHLLVAPLPGDLEAGADTGAPIEDPVLAAVGLAPLPPGELPEAVRLLSPPGPPLSAALGEAPGLAWWVAPGLERAWLPEGDPEAPAHAVQLSYGDGHVTVLGSLAPLRNDALDAEDHAALAWELLHPHGQPPAGVLVLLRGDATGLSALLWRHARPLLISALATLLAWAWARSGRLGPVLPPPPRVRRSTLEHVAASGRFLWRHGQHAVLLASMRAAVGRRLARRLGPSGDLQGAALVDDLAARTSLPREVVLEALFGGGPADRRAFTRAVQALSQLWSVR